MSLRRLTRTHGKLLSLALTAAAIGALALAATASAVTHHPKGEYAPFADCPLSNAKISSCLLAKTEGGEFVIGSTKVPIVSTITLQGGIEKFLSGEESVVAAEDGNTLSKTPQKVPGGLAGFVKCNEVENFIERILCEVTFENGVTGVNAITELAAPASSIGLHTANLLGATGTALSLPVKVRLENPLLGSSCYIGSNAKPIVIEFTTGKTSPPPPNKSISGNPGEASFNEAETIITIKNNSLVNNSFAAPKIEIFKSEESCGLLTPIVNSKIGLPSAAGKNTAILKGKLQVASAEAVKASE